MQATIEPHCAEYAASPNQLRFVLFSVASGTSHDGWMALPICLSVCLPGPFLSQLENETF